MINLDTIKSKKEDGGGENIYNIYNQENMYNMLKLPQIIKKNVEDPVGKMCKRLE